jgi:hypothetical protein
MVLGRYQRYQFLNIKTMRKAASYFYIIRRTWNTITHVWYRQELPVAEGQEVFIRGTKRTFLNF